MDISARELEQSKRYSEYYQAAGSDRNDLSTNRGVLFQTLASEASFVSAFRHVRENPSEMRVLDVGCGSGGSWFQLFRMGIRPQNIVGIEVQKERVEAVKQTYPQAAAVHGDAACTPFEDESFDMVYESTLFATLSDDAVRLAIAAEMIRVCKVGGYILLIDWRIGKFWDSHYKALSRRELRRLFDLGRSCTERCTCPGALIPPVGRFLSRHLSSSYFLAASFCPILVGQVAYLLQKTKSTQEFS